MTAIKPDPAVLIVGAGPTGLTLAIELARRAVPVRIVDRLTDPPLHSRGLGVQPRTLEVFERIGVIDAALEAGQIARGFNFYSDRRRIGGLTFAGLDAPYPFMFALEQSQTERVLTDRLRDLGVAVDRGVEATALTQDDHGVVVTLRQPAGLTEQIHTDWVVGCDGAHSTVRDLLGLPFAGATYPDHWLLGDMHIDWRLPTDEVHGFFSPTGLLFTVPLGNARYRLITLKPDHGVSDTPDDIFAYFADVTARLTPGGATLGDPRWLGTFSVHRRMVDRMRAGRVFLAGDAAHIHSPAGGLGLNDGIQDAHNLGWKLALIHHDAADVALLDSYHDERHPIAVATQRGTDLATRAIGSGNPLLQRIRRAVVPRVLNRRAVQRRLVPLATQLRVAYPNSSIVEHHSPEGRRWLRRGSQGPRAGERAPDARLAVGTAGPDRLFELFTDPRHVLLLFAGLDGDAEGRRRLAEIAAEVRHRWGAEVAVHLLSTIGGPHVEAAVVLDDGDAHERYAAASMCAYLVRPDGYIACATDTARLDAITGYLDRHLQQRSPGTRGTTTATAATAPVAPITGGTP